MRIVNRVVASRGLVLVLAFTGCANDGGPAAMDSGSGTYETSTAPSTEPGDTAPDPDTTDTGDPPTTSGESHGTSTSGEPPMGTGWCTYEIIAGVDQTPLNVYAAPDPSSAVLYTLAVGETVQGSTTVVAGYRDIDRAYETPQWAEAARLEYTGECEADEPPEQVPLPQAFQLPFVCGDAWRLDTWGHAPAIDMVREPDQEGTEGAPLFAPAAGVVNQSYYHDNAGNMVQIDHGEGWFTTYIHMDSRAVEVGAVLAQGDMIGAVGRTGPTSNNHPHLHFELAIDADGDGEASWGFEGAERVRPWFGGVEYGQDDAMTWRDVVSMNCP